MYETSNQFIEALNRKEVNAYHTLFEDYYVSLVMYAMNYVPQEVAEDIVQDLVTFLWEKHTIFPSVHAFRAFLYTSVRNRSINYLKHKKAEANYITRLQVQEETAEQDVYDIMEEEIYRIFFKVIDELPERCREIFKLHLAGKKEEEIAALLHVSLSTVKSQKQKAFHRLKDALGKFILFLFFL